MNIDVNVTIQVSGTANDLGKLADLFAALGNSGLKVAVLSGSAPGLPAATSKAAPAPAAPAAKPAAPAKTRARKKLVKKVAAAAAAPSTEPQDIAEKYSSWSRAKYKAPVRKEWDKQLKAAREAYLAAAGDRAASGRSHKSWSINKFKRETAALAVAVVDAEATPATEKAAPKKSGRGGKRKK